MSGLTKSSPATLRPAFIFAMAMFGLVATTERGWSQVPPQPQQTQAPESPASAAPAMSNQPLPIEPAPVQHENPGLFNEIGKLFKAPDWALPKLKNPFEALDVFHHDVKNAPDSSSRLNAIVKGRTLCPVAANGAPDCKTASDRLCQSKGFKEGKSIDTDAFQRCSARVFLPGYKRQEGDCTTENHVTQALCQ